MKNSTLALAIGLTAIVVIGGYVFVRTAFRQQPSVALPKAQKERNGAPKEQPDIGAVGTIERVPDVAPGDSLDKIINLYGKESSVDEYYHNWRTPSFWMSLAVDKSQHITEVSLDIAPTGPHSLVTPDGIVLGKDTLKQFREKLGERVMTACENLYGGEDTWVLEESIRRPSAPSLNIKYRWSLNESTEIQRKILYGAGPDPVPEVFAGVPVIGYTLMLSQDASKSETACKSQGQPDPSRR